MARESVSDRAEQDIKDTADAVRDAVAKLNNAIGNACANGLYVDIDLVDATTVGNFSRQMHVTVHITRDV